MNRYCHICAYMEQTSSEESHYVTECIESKKNNTGFHIIGLYSPFALCFTLAFAVLGKMSSLVSFRGWDHANHKHPIYSECIHC